MTPAGFQKHPQESKAPCLPLALLAALRYALAAGTGITGESSILLGGTCRTLHPEASGEGRRRPGLSPEETSAHSSWIQLLQPQEISPLLSPSAGICGRQLGEPITIPEYPAAARPTPALSGRCAGDPAQLKKDRLACGLLSCFWPTPSGAQRPWLRDPEVQGQNQGQSHASATTPDFCWPRSSLTQ